MNTEEWNALVAAAQVAQQPAGSLIYQPLPPEITFDCTAEEFAAQMADLERRLA